MIKTGPRVLCIQQQSCTSCTWSRRLRIPRVMLTGASSWSSSTSIETFARQPYKPQPCHRACAPPATCESGRHRHTLRRWNQQQCSTSKAIGNTKKMIKIIVAKIQSKYHQRRPKKKKEEHKKVRARCPTSLPRVDTFTQSPRLRRGR